MKNKIHPIQFSLFRMILGAYLLFHFIFLLPISKFLFSAEGMLQSVTLNPTYGLFPINLLNKFDNPVLVNIFLYVLIFLSFSLIVGFKRRWSSAILLYGWLALFNRNNLILTPGLAFVGWLLAIMIFIPEGEPYSFRAKKSNAWEVPSIVFVGAWLIMSVSYTLSGIDKLSSPSWTAGTALYKLLFNPLMRDTHLVELFRSQPSALLQTITYIILLTELFFFPASLFALGRAIIWTLMVLIHLGILILMNISDLTIAMLMIHVFTFDQSWLKSKTQRNLSS